MTAFRRMLPVDRDFVISGWSSSYRLSKTAGLISMARWAQVMHPEILALISHRSVAVTVAYEPGEYVQSRSGPRPFHYGFIAIGDRAIPTPRGWQPYVLYVYVKSAYRQGRRRGLDLGFASQLFAHVGVDPRLPFVYACSTPVVSDLVSKIPLASFDPLPARFLESHEHPVARTEDRPEAR